MIAVRSTTHRAIGRALAIKPQRDYKLTEAEREAFDEGTLAEAEQMARWLCGEDLMYSREQIKGWRIAAVIRTLVRITQRIIDSKTSHRVREIERENKALREHADAQRAELRRLWVVESKYKALKAVHDQGMLNLEGTG